MATVHPQHIKQNFLFNLPMASPNRPTPGASSGPFNNSSERHGPDHGTSGAYHQLRNNNNHRRHAAAEDGGGATVYIKESAEPPESLQMPGQSGHHQLIASPSAEELEDVFAERPDLYHILMRPPRSTAPHASAMVC